MLVSKCCGAEIKSSPNGCYISCICCSASLDINNDVIDQDKPSINVIEMPEMTEEWREKIKFKKEAKNENR